MHRIIQALVLVSVAAGSSFAQAPKTRLNRTIELLANDEPAFGVFGWNQSVDNAIAIARSDLDFVIIDLEHRPYDVDRLRTFLLAMTDKGSILEKGSLQMNVTPIVRLPASNVESTVTIAKQVLGMGAFGLMFPTVATKEEAVRAVQASRYPQTKGAADTEPRGLRGFEPFHPGMWYWGLNAKEYYERADTWPLDPNGEVLVVFQIESQEGIDNIEDIVSVPGLGAVLVGSYDLSTSLGVPGDVSGPDVTAAVRTVFEACQARGIPMGATGGSIEQQLEQGFKFLAVGADIGLPARASENLRRAKELSGR